MKDLKCLRCGTEMNSLGREKVQLGEYGPFLGHISNLMAGAMELDLFACPKCGKVEFFSPVPDAGEPSYLTDPELPQQQCPNCGGIHDFDFPKCPYCGMKYR